MTNLPKGSESLLAQTDWLRRLTTELTGDVPAAEDLAQETVLAALTAPSPDRANIRTWLRGIARNLAAFSYRSESRRRRHERGAAEMSPPPLAPSAADVCTKFALHSSVVDAVMDLDDKVRAVLLLRFWEDLSAQEIATQIGQPVETVRTRIKLGIAQMRGRLDGEHGDCRIWATALLGNMRTETAVAYPSIWAGVLAMSMPTKLVVITSVLLFTCFWAGLFSTGQVFEPDHSIGLAGPQVVGLEKDASTDTPEALGNTEPGEIARRAVGAVGQPDNGTTEPAALSGTIRDENEQPIAFADVYLAMVPPRDKDFLGRLSAYFRPDYYKRSRFLQTKTDREGGYRFEAIREYGDARLGAFKANYSDPITAGSRYLDAVKIAPGVTLTDIDLVMAAGKTASSRTASDSI